MKIFIAVVCLIAVRPAWALTTESLASSRPNFVVFFLDDFGFGDLGANNAATKETPHMNALAASGMRFTDLHAGASVCTPSRAALLTGRLGLRTGITHNFAPPSVAGLPTNETTFSEVLKQNGYSTAMIGKWHLGTTKGFHPFDRGFDHTWIIPYSIDMGCNDQCGATDQNMPRNVPVNGRCKNESTQHVLETSHLSPAIPYYGGNTTVTRQPMDLCALASTYADVSTRFIHEHKNEPFLLYAPLSQMHVPHAHAPQWTNTSSRGIFGDTLREADWTVGQILSALESAGVRNNTLVMLFGDNGPWEVKCELAGSHAPFTGEWMKQREGGGGSTGKFTAWEGGHRVAGLFSWPGVIPSGSVNEGLASTMDVLPTLAHLSGASLPAHRQFDGVNLTPNLLSATAAPAHATLFHPESGTGTVSGGGGEDAEAKGTIIAMRMGAYKAHFQTGGSAPACGGKNAKLTAHDPPLLFDLSTDPQEGNALDTSLPEYASVVAQMKDHLKQLMANIKADNTTTADYSTAAWASPCCNQADPLCRCN